MYAGTRVLEDRARLRNVIAFRHNNQFWSRSVVRDSYAGNLAYVGCFGFLLGGQPIGDNFNMLECGGVHIMCATSSMKPGTCHLPKHPDRERAQAFPPLQKR
jgi:hypothetical protein